MNIVIPMAGRGTRFAQAGYTFPKPLIAVNGRPMIQVVVENLDLDAHYIFIVQRDHYIEYYLEDMLKTMVPGCDVVPIGGITEGAACTVLQAEAFINNDEPLLIANSDQTIEWESRKVIKSLSGEQVDGGIVTVKSVNPAYSYVKLKDGLVDYTAEKRVISELATTGHYYWSRGADFVRYAEQMIEKNIRVNNEFYVCPVYNEAIQDGLRFRTELVPKMWSLGTPEDLNYYLKEHHS